MLNKYTVIFAILLLMGIGGCFASTLLPSGINNHNPSCSFVTNIQPTSSWTIDDYKANMNIGWDPTGNFYAGWWNNGWIGVDINNDGRLEFLSPSGTNSGTCNDYIGSSAWQILPVQALGGFGLIYNENGQQLLLCDSNSNFYVVFTPNTNVGSVPCSDATLPICVPSCVGVCDGSDGCSGTCPACTGNNNSNSNSNTNSSTGNSNSGTTTSSFNLNWLTNTAFPINGFNVQWWMIILGVILLIILIK